MVYLFYGDDRAAKEGQIAKIKADCLRSPEALKFDYEFLHGVKLDPDTFKQALIALPAVAPKRLVLVRAVEKLDAPNQAILTEFLQSPHDHVVLILETDEADLKSGFFGKVRCAAKAVCCARAGKQENVWSATRAIERRRPAEAVRILNDLMEAGDPPLKVLGALVWFWGSLKHRLPSEGFKKGLLVLQEADLNIKRSRLKPEYAVEVAVTQLSLLVVC